MLDLFYYYIMFQLLSNTIGFTYNLLLLLSINLNYKYCVKYNSFIVFNTGSWYAQYENENMLLCYFKKHLINYYNNLRFRLAFNLMKVLPKPNYEIK